MQSKLEQIQSDFRIEIPDAPWVTLPNGTQFTLSRAYLHGAWDAQKGGRITYKNPYQPGPEMAQYNYGHANELQGQHDEMDLPFPKDFV
jgi:hypothetical protein